MLSKEVLFTYYPKYTVQRYKTLIRVFSCLENAWNAEFDEMKKTDWDNNLIHEFLTWKDHLDESALEYGLQKNNIEAITIHDDTYPEILKYIYDPPTCLFVRGKLQKQEMSLAVVGSRKNSFYGQQTVESLVSILAKKGITLVSGLAYGIDSIVHATTLRNQGRTIAVLGGGIDNGTIYPREHIPLAESILQNGGALVSEYPPGFSPTKYTFPMRNRIIAGLSLATLVIEATEKSGALTTAQYALDNSRDVFAIPHNIQNINGAGCNNLLKTGAKMVTSAEDILEYFHLNEEKNTGQEALFL
ncbi:MAG: DNA-processing protein DprA [Candidatus Magasanikbacteria bacterium]